MNDPVCWIETIAETSASAELAAIYDEVRSSNGQLDNLYQGFSLRSHTIKPADDLYRAVLHHDGNSLPKWFSELIGTYVAILAGCTYAQAHHGENYIHLSENAERARNVLNCLRSGDLEQCGDTREVCVLRYVTKLSRNPDALQRSDVDALRANGWDDGDILEIAQIVAMFSYYVRVINGVGISLGDEKLGLY